MTSYLLGLLLFLAAPQGDLPESDANAIGYATVDDALRALRADRTISESEQNGWLVFQDEAHKTIWSFPPKDHPAFPSAVKREFTKRDGAVYLQMHVLCGASKKACDQLVRDFKTLNQQMSEAIRTGKSSSGKSP